MMVPRGDSTRLSPALILGLAIALCAFLPAVSEARRHLGPRPEHQVTPGKPMDDGGWRPVIDSRISHDAPQPLQMTPTGPEAHADQTADLIPPPRSTLTKVQQLKKPLKSVPVLLRKPIGVKAPSSYHVHHEPSHSETRVNPTTFTIPPPEGPTRTMRFPDDKRRANAQSHQQQARRRPPHPYHHSHHHPEVHPHHHIRQNTHQATSESQQHLRFRPSPQVPPNFENSYPGWLVPNEQEHQVPQQTQLFYGGDNPTGILQLQQAFNTPEAQAQIQLALAQQQPDLAQQLQHNAYVHGTQQIFGNPGLFNLNPDLQKEAVKNQESLFLAPSITQPSVHENEVPQGIFLPPNNRGRPIRPGSDIPSFPPEPTAPTFVLQTENTDLRPRRPRPPNGIQAQLESSRRPQEDVRPTDATREESIDVNKYKPRHPRPPSTEPPSWSHPVLDSKRPQTEERDPPNAIPKLRRPRPPVLKGEIPENPRIRRPRPQLDQSPWKPSTISPTAPSNHKTEEEMEENDEPETELNARRPRPPPPVEEHLDDDVVRPVFSLRPRRPQKPQEDEVEEEEDVFKPKRVKPQRQQPVEGPEEQSPDDQEDIDEVFNVRPRRPRPPHNGEDRVRLRRPRPPQDVFKRRRPRPPVNEEDNFGDRRRKPVTPATTVEEVAEEDERSQQRPLLRRPMPSKTRYEEPVEEVPVEHDQEEEEEEQDIYGPEEQPVTEEVHEYVETTPEPTTTTPAPTPPKPTIPSKRRRPVIKEESVKEELDEATENYPAQLKPTTEAPTTPMPTTTLPPTTTGRHLINPRLRLRNNTRPRFSVGDPSLKERINRFNSNRNRNDDESTTPMPPSGDDSKQKMRNRESSRFRLGTTTTTGEPSTERTTFKPSMVRYSPRVPGSKFYSRYRATTEEPATTTISQDATRRTNDNLFTIKERKPFPALKTRTTESNNQDVTENDVSIPVTPMAFSVSEVTTEMPETTTDYEDITEEVPTTEAPQVPITPAEDFSPAKRVTDLTSSATAFKPLSFFSAVPANGKAATQLSKRFTMATEDPILPIQAFFPTFTSRSNSEEKKDE